MDEFEFAFETNENGSEMLIRRDIKHTDQPNVMTVTKIPIMNDQIFKMCYDRWINKKEETK